jgi:hypothetical protein
MRRREGDRDTRAERFAHQNDTITVISAHTRFPIGGFAILHQALLCRRASRTAIAAIGYRKKSVSARRKGAKTRNAIDQSAAIAVKIQDQRMPVLCRNIPSDQHLAIIGRKTQVFDAAHAGLRGIDQTTIWKILKPALKYRQANDHQNVNRYKASERPFQYSHGDLPHRMTSLVRLRLPLSLDFGNANYPSFHCFTRVALVVRGEAPGVQF